MRLEDQGNKFNTSPYLTTAIDDHLVETLSLDHFDKDGYEVPALLERKYYQAQNIVLDNEIQYHIAPAQEWYKDIESSEIGLVLDHCMLLTRHALAGDARDQLLAHIQHRPILNKLLAIRPKWGIDFSLDYVDVDQVMEVIHIEQDFDDINVALAAKENLAKIIENTDWHQGAMQLLERKDEWVNLSSDDQSDYKAHFFGIHRAFDNKKVLSA